MRKLWAPLAFACLLATTPAHSQTAQSAAGANAVGVGVGVGTARSNSTAISGQGGRAAAQANGNGNSSLTVNSAAQPTATTATVNTQLTGTSTVRNVPTAVAPSLAAAGLETCLGSASGGASVVGFGASFGTTYVDEGCQARLSARTMYSMGLKAAALARLCLDPSSSWATWRSMPDVCNQYVPRQEQRVVLASAALPPQVADAYAVGQPIELIDGRTGQARMCADYNSAQQRCKVWTDGRRHAAVHPKKTAVHTAATKPAASAAGEDKSK